MGGKINLGPTPLLFPTPVVLVTCKSASSRPNIITIAWTGIVNSQPPMIGISIQPPRYSHDLIRNAGEFGVNVPSRDLLRIVDYCGIVSGRNVDKFKETGLTLMSSEKIKTPLIHECPVNLECVLRHFLHLGMHDLFIGEIVATHVDESAVDSSGQLDSSKIDAVGYFSRPRDYWSLNERIGVHGFTGGHR